MTLNNTTLPWDKTYDDQMKIRLHFLLKEPAQDPSLRPSQARAKPEPSPSGAEPAPAQPVHEARPAAHAGAVLLLHLQTLRIAGVS